VVTPPLHQKHTTSLPPPQPHPHTHTHTHIHTHTHTHTHTQKHLCLKECIWFCQFAQRCIPTGRRAARSSPEIGRGKSLADKHTGSRLKPHQRSVCQSQGSEGWRFTSEG